MGGSDLVDPGPLRRRAFCVALVELFLGEVGRTGQHRGHEVQEHTILRRHSQLGLKQPDAALKFTVEVQKGLVLGLTGPDAEDQLECAHGWELILLVAKNDLVEGCKETAKGPDPLHVAVKVRERIKALFHKLGDLPHDDVVELAALGLE